MAPTDGKPATKPIAFLSLCVVLWTLVPFAASDCSPSSFRSPVDGQKVCTTVGSTVECQLTCDLDYVFHDLHLNTTLTYMCTDGDSWENVVSPWPKCTLANDPSQHSRFRQVFSFTFDNLADKNVLCTEQQYLNLLNDALAQSEASLSSVQCGATVAGNMVAQATSVDNKRVTMDVTLTWDKTSYDVYIPCAAAVEAAFNDVSSAVVSPFIGTFSSADCKGLSGNAAATFLSSVAYCETGTLIQYNSADYNVPIEVCLDCPPGTQVEVAGCSECTIGSYSSQMQCLPCPESTTTAFAGAISVDECLVPPTTTTTEATTTTTEPTTEATTTTTTTEPTTTTEAATTASTPETTTTTTGPTPSTAESSTPSATTETSTAETSPPSATTPPSTAETSPQSTASTTEATPPTATTSPSTATTTAPSSFTSGLLTDNAEGVSEAGVPVAILVPAIMVPIILGAIAAIIAVFIRKRKKKKKVEPHGETTPVEEYEQPGDNTDQPATGEDNTQLDKYAEVDETSPKETATEQGDPQPDGQDTKSPENQAETPQTAENAQQPAENNPQPTENNAQPAENPQLAESNQQPAENNAQPAENPQPAENNAQPTENNAQPNESNQQPTENNPQPTENS